MPFRLLADKDLSASPLSGQASSLFNQYDREWRYVHITDIINFHRMKKHRSAPAAVGIDVAKGTLSVCIRTPEGGERALTLRNIESDISKKLLPQLTYCTGKVVMESTGHYHWASALLLRQAGLDVRVVNPLLAKQYTAGNIRKVKTDPADAAGLARMAAVSDNLPPPFSLSKNRLYLRKKLATLASMTHQLQALTASMTSMREAQNILGVPLESEAITAVAEVISALKRSLVKLERECVRETKADAQNQEVIPLLTSIPGVSEFCAALSLQWFILTPETTDKSWIAFAGLDISSRSSGTWRGRCKLTKRGNSFLRKRLYAAAWGATMNNADFKSYYTELRSQGRAHVEALVIIARKIVRTMFVVQKTQTPFNASKFHYKNQAVD